MESTRTRPKFILQIFLLYLCMLTALRFLDGPSSGRKVILVLAGSNPFPSKVRVAFPCVLAVVVDEEVTYRKMQKEVKA